MSDDADDADGPESEAGADDTPEEEAEAAPEDGEAADDAATDAEDEGAVALSEEELNERLDAAEEDLEAAETEADLDGVEATLDEVEAGLDAAELPEPDDEDEESPAEALEGRLSDLRDDLEAARGPYAEDVVAEIEDAQGTIEDTRWTGPGLDDVAAAVDAFLADAGDVLDAEFGRAPEEDEPAELAAALDPVAEAVAAAGFDPDEDADDIGALLDATGALADGLGDAEEWDDLETHEQLREQGFYDVLGHYKDFPPEWAAVQEHRQQGNVDMVLLALENLQSDFMERHCLEALSRMNDDGAFDEMHARAEKRDRQGILILGKMAAEEAVDTLLEYVDADSDPQLQKVTFKALGEIGAEEAVGPIANQLRSDSAEVRRFAVRALGLIGDTRAIDPLGDVLADDDDQTVRRTAAWALRQIGTEGALQTAAEFDDDDTFTVRSEAEKARDALDAAATPA